MQVLIAGAGVGGLTTSFDAAQSAASAPASSTQASRVREVGVGINTLPHAIEQLAELGLLDRLDEVAIRTRELRYLTKHGQEVWREPARTSCRP